MIDQLKELIQIKQFWWIVRDVVFLIVLSAAVDTLPNPKPGGSRFYQFFYAFLHGITGRFRRAWTIIQMLLPGIKAQAAGAGQQGQNGP